MIRWIHLFPHKNGVPDLAARGECALLYKRRDDLHFRPVWDQVTEEFTREYIATTIWCQYALKAGREFLCLPTLGICSEGMTIQ